MVGCTLLSAAALARALLRSAAVCPDCAAALTAQVCADSSRPHTLTVPRWTDVASEPLDQSLATASPTLYASPHTWACPCDAWQASSGLHISTSHPASAALQAAPCSLQAPGESHLAVRNATRSGLSNLCTRMQARAGQPAVQQTSYEPAWLPAPASEVEEPACRQALQNMQQAPVAVSGFRRPLQTTFLGPSGYPGGADGPP